MQVLEAPKIFTPEYYQHMRQLEERSWWNAGMRDLALQILGSAGLPTTGTMIDIGCGSGQTMAWFKQLRPGWRIFGVDVAPEGLASALQLPLPSACADLIVTLDVIQHLPLRGGDRTAFREFGRVLKPGGHLFVRTNAQAFPRAADDQQFDFHKYEVPELRGRLQAAGFEVLLISRVNALLGLAEIPRELKAKNQKNSYHGILSPPAAHSGWSSTLKRKWLGLEARMVCNGMALPFGRTIVALARAGRA
jgi:SAM-dependent methyltransferase